MDKHVIPGTYQYPTNPSNQGNIRKSGWMQHHQDQDAPISCIGHIWNLRFKSPHFRKQKTRRILADGEGLQDRNLRDRNYVRYRIHFLRNMLCGESLREFELLQSQVVSKTNRHLNLIKEVLLGYFLLSKHSTSIKAQWDAQCGDLEISYSRYLTHK